MHLQSKIWVRQNVEQVGDFFHAPDSLAKWNKNVAEMIPGLIAGNNARATFETISPSDIKMNYRVIEFNSQRSVKILVTKSGMFKEAIWHFQFHPSGTGTAISCHVCFTVRFPYQFLFPVLYFSKKALSRDLNYLRKAIDDNYRENLLESIKNQNRIYKSKKDEPVLAIE